MTAFKEQILGKGRGERQSFSAPRLQVFLDFSLALLGEARILYNSVNLKRRAFLNSELCKQALAKVVNPNVLVNLVSRRVRQLTSGSGGSSRPLILDHANLGMADIALREIIEDKMGWTLLEEGMHKPAVSAKKRKKS